LSCPLTLGFLTTFLPTFLDFLFFAMEIYRYAAAELLDEDNSPLQLAGCQVMKVRVNNNVEGLSNPEKINIPLVFVNRDTKRVQLPGNNKDWFLSSIIEAHSKKGEPVSIIICYQTINGQPVENPQ